MSRAVQSKRRRCLSCFVTAVFANVLACKAEFGKCTHPVASHTVVSYVGEVIFKIDLI